MMQQTHEDERNGNTTSDKFRSGFNTGHVRWTSSRGIYPRRVIENSDCVTHLHRFEFSVCVGGGRAARVNDPANPVAVIEALMFEWQQSYDGALGGLEVSGERTGSEGSDRAESANKNSQSQPNSNVD